MCSDPENDLLDIEVEELELDAALEEDREERALERGLSPDDPQIVAMGEDDNVDFEFLPQGTGVKLAGYSPSGYRHPQKLPRYKRSGNILWLGAAQNVVGGRL